jgi:hypothetical protein
MFLSFGVIFVVDKVCNILSVAMCTSLIRKIVVVVVLVVCASSSLQAQTSQLAQPLKSADDIKVSHLLERHVGRGFANTWNIGSAKKLNGKIYVLEIWLASSNNLWNLSDMTSMRRKVVNAVRWLEALTRKYGSDAVFEVGSFFGPDNRGIVVDELPKSYNDCFDFSQILMSVLNKLGYVNETHFYKRICSIYNADNLAVLLIINGDGRSSASQFSVGHLNGYRSKFLETAFIFVSNNNIPTESQCIAHEILHLFGAWDMYKGQVSEQSAKWAMSNYPNEIMLQVLSPLDELVVSPLTAWLTGLSTEYCDWYWNFVRTTK